MGVAPSTTASGLPENAATAYGMVIKMPITDRMTYATIVALEMANTESRKMNTNRNNKLMLSSTDCNEYNDVDIGWNMSQS
eukprot:CAMPEP_0202723498 /NCGR_PEP_ID=MMETSP1385-20130828/166149_1 /ASSEMBLY_ACC=CAM_ASM_000861 /TAXON_ID=933848 /ORGANISM="Elphidium margaritaceum" /LENGTH=80 /DNA_ID=CAMNT_0049388673 /DNA_START=28 /DNA_END=267 /DNA_ORIENTATION=-